MTGLSPFSVKENGELSRSLAKLLACSGKGKIVGITLIPVISTYRAKFGMIRRRGEVRTPFVSA